jgi:hypothetical protein
MGKPHVAESDDEHANALHGAILSLILRASIVHQAPSKGKRIKAPLNPTRLIPFQIGRPVKPDGIKPTPDQVARRDMSRFLTPSVIARGDTDGA